jgi:hypothetical protein
MEKIKPITRNTIESSLVAGIVFTAAASCIAAAVLLYKVPGILYCERRRVKVFAMHLLLAHMPYPPNNFL